MNSRPSQILTLLVLSAIATITPVRLSAQSKSSDVAALLKSIGITKPAMAKAPDFTLRDVGGGLVSLASYRGSFVLLNFWATWCGPCREEMPSMEALSRSFGGQGLSLLAVNQKESVAQVSSFMKTHGLNFPTPLDADGRVSAAYRVFGIPVSYVIDANGNAIGMKSGARDWASRDVLDVFRKLVGSSAGPTAGGTLDLEPSAPLPSALRTKSGAAILRTQQDAHSEALAKLTGGEEVIPLGKASGAGEYWYMVRTKNGAVGWLRGAEVEEVKQSR